MRLFYAAASPFVRSVMIALHETGLIDTVELIDVTVTPMGPTGALHAANPLGKIPCLIRDDGKALFDSRVICRFLAAQSPATGLYPDGNALWNTLTLEAMAVGIMESAVLITYEGRLRPEAQQSPEWISGQWGKIDRTLGAIEQSWMAHLNGPSDMASFAIAAALGYLDFRHDARGWRNRHPVLSCRETAFAKRRSIVVTKPV